MSSVIVFLVTVLLATLPVIELRGAMPIGMSKTLWGNSALSLWESGTACVIGGIVACFIVVAIFIPLKKLLSRITICRKFFDCFDKKANEYILRFSPKIKHNYSQNNKNSHLSLANSPIKPHTNTITFPTSTPHPKTRSQHDNTFAKCVFVFLFCATPLPFTGVWSAGALCSLLGLRFFPSVLALISANLLGSGVVMLFCLIFSDYIDLVLVIMAIILLLTILYYFAKFLLSSPKIKDNSTFFD